MRESKQEALDGFEGWLAYMDEAIQNLFVEMPEEAEPHMFGYSADGLQVLEEWLLGRYADTSSIREASEAHILDGAARYFGESLRKSIGGSWRIELDNKDNAYFNIPQVNGIVQDYPPVCPLRVVVAAMGRRTGHELSRVFRAMSDAKAEASQESS